MRPVVRQGLSVGVATGTYGVSFGALAVSAGLDTWQACALSVLMFTGGSQFALVAVLGTGGGAASAVATSTLLGLRNGLYSMQLSRLLRPRGARRLVAAQLTIDESTAVAIGQDEPSAGRLGFWVTGLAVFAVWNAATLVGALLGDALGDPRRYGLDAAAAAAFLALLWPRLQDTDSRVLAAAAAVLALVLVPLVPAGVPVLAAALVALVAGARAARGAVRT